MTRLRKLAGTLILLGPASLYGTLALLRGHSAAAEPPADLSAREAGLEVWRALALLAAPGEPPLLLDVRPRERFELYHLPRSENLPGADARLIAERARAGRAVLLVGDKDEAAAALVGEARRLAPGARIHFLQEGARALYLALELPVPLFSDSPVPFGYQRALEKVQAWLRRPEGVDRDAVVEALGLLSRAGYAPTALQAKKRAPAGPAKKKISGGCG
jgi:hypothetical protein